MILNYLGSKSSLIKYLDYILSTIPNKSKYVFCEPFAGSGIVSSTFSNVFKNVISNDMELYSYVINYALLRSSYTTKVKEIIEYLNKKTGNNHLILKEFSPPKRKFFTNQNACIIDECRLYMHELLISGDITYDEFIFLLASLLVSLSKIANTCGTFRAYLKQFSNRSLSQMKLYPIHKKTQKSCRNSVTLGDAVTCAKKNNYDVIYIDPPYNSTHYGAYYSLLNYVCLYDEKIELKGSGFIKKYYKSKFGLKKKACIEFRKLIKNIHAKHIVLSYSSSALLSINYISQLLCKKGSLTIYTIQYKKYKSKTTQSTTVNEHFEYIFHVDCTQQENPKIIYKKLDFI